MRIVIAGGTGFLGNPLSEVYAEEGHDVRVLTRGLPVGASRHDSGTGVPGVTRVGWRPDGQSGAWASALDGADAVINLAGEGIGDRRWTPQRKALIRDSRVIPTRSLAAGIAGASCATGLHQRQRSGILRHGGWRHEDRARRPATTFLRTCAKSGKPRRSASRRSHARRHDPLRRRARARRRRPAQDVDAVPLFRRRTDGIGTAVHVVDPSHRLDRDGPVDRRNTDVTGPVNVTAPAPVTNREFARALGRAIRRPAVLPAPAPALKLMLGEMAEPLVLRGQRAIPQCALSHGFISGAEDRSGVQRDIW